MKLENDKINNRTHHAKDHIDDLLQHLENIQDDTYKEDRLKRQECRYCYYTPIMSGQCMTKYKCEICGKECLHENTDTPRYCKECAKENNICIHCGADINLKLRRNL